MVLSEEQYLIQQTAAKFARESLAPYASAWEDEGAIPTKTFEAMGDCGFFGMSVPEEYGGAQTDFVSYAAAMMEVAAGNGAVSTIMSIQNSLICAAILASGSDAQKKRWLPQLVTGSAIGAFCLTEAQAGSDAAAIRTRAARTGDNYTISGSKQFISSGKIAKLAIIFAVTDPAAGRKGITAFLVPTDTRGYRVAKVEDKLGQKASDTCEIVFEDMVVSRDHVLGIEGDGYKIALANLESGRIGIASQSIGMAQAALSHAIDYAKERTTFGKKIIEHQAVGFRLAESAAALEAARQLVFHAASLKDANKPCLQEACMAKLVASETAERVCSAALQTLGGYGYLRDFPIERIYRDVRVCQIYEGTSDIQKLVIARGLSA